MILAGKESSNFPCIYVVFEVTYASHVLARSILYADGGAVGIDDSSTNITGRWVLEHNEARYYGGEAVNRLRPSL